MSKTDFTKQQGSIAISTHREDLNNNELKALPSTSDVFRNLLCHESKEDIFSFCTEYILNNIKEVGFENKTDKAKVYSPGFRNFILNTLLDKAMANLTDIESTVLDFRYVKAWKMSTTDDEKLLLLKLQLGINPKFKSMLAKAYIQEYISYCLELGIPFDDNIVIPYITF